MTSNIYWIFILLKIFTNFINVTLTSVLCRYAQFRNELPVLELHNLMVVNRKWEVSKAN